MNIYLTGYRGTGKSTVASLLAQRLGHPWTMVDMDDRIEQQARKAIAEIFADDGEDTFRNLETKVLGELADMSNIVVATGGGVILREENRERLREGFVVYLSAKPETIEARLSADATTRTRRPSLTSKGSIAEIRDVLEHRIPIYRSLAACTVETDALAPALVADQIASAFAIHLSGGT